MNILFLTMSKMSSIDQHGIYTDLMRKFRDEGHKVYVVYPCERREKLQTKVNNSHGVYILSVKTLNVQKTNVIEKGLGQITLEYLYERAIKKFFGEIKFNLILYTTPPIILTKVIESAKRNNPHSVSYLLLKDIFPQNAVDLGMLSKNGMKGILYKSFRKKEKSLYKISDHIGCMSPANVRYLLEHNSEVNSHKVEIAPNSIDLTTSDENRQYKDQTLLNKYKLPSNIPILIYGGNLGKPQGIPFLISCLEANSQRIDCHFLIVGDGIEYSRLETWYKGTQPQNVTVMKFLPKEDYDNLVNSCHVGLIFLDHRFTIPNFPSRLLTYLECRIPVIVASDINSDMGQIAEKNGFGYWCQSNNIDAFTKCVNKMLNSNLKEMGDIGYTYLKQNYSIENTYNAIVKHVQTSN